MTRRFIPPRYVAVPSQLIAGPERLPDMLRDTYIVILYFAWQNDYRSTEASVEDISTIRGLGYRTVWDHLRQLEQLGAVTLEGGRGSPRRIILHIRPAIRADSQTEQLRQTAQPRYQLSRVEDMKSVAERQKHQQSDFISPGADIEENRRERSVDVDQHQQQYSLLFQDALHLLLEFGVSSRTAEDLARTCTPDQIKGWMAYAKDPRNKIRNPQGFVVDRLGKREQPPPTKPKPGSKEDRYRYFRGEYADYIEH